MASGPRDQSGTTAGGIGSLEPAELIADLAAAILRRWRLVLFVAAVVIAGVYGFMQLRADIWQVEARLLVKVGPENLEMPTTVSRGALVSNGVRKEDINSDVILLESRHLIAHAVDTIGLEAFRAARPEPVTVLARIRRAASDSVRWMGRQAEAALIALRLAKPMTERDKLIQRIERNLDVKREGESDVIEVTLRFGSGPLAVRVIDEMIEQFLIERAAARRAVGTIGFFEEQVERARASLADLDARIAALRAEKRLTSSADERKLLLEQRASVEAAIVAAEQARATVAPIRHFADRIDARLAATTMGGAPYPIVLGSIGELMVKRTAEVGEIAASGRVAQELEEKIGALILLLERSVADDIRLRQAEMGRIDARLEVLNVADQQMLLLLGEREVTQSRYDDYNLRLEEERVNSRLEERRVANIAVLAPPALPLAPVGPRRLALTLVSVPLGLVLGIALAGMLGYADTRVWGARDLARIPGVAVLGEVSPAELGA